MSQRSLPGAARLRLAAPIVGRDPSEGYRAATPLELFFDLVFVVAVSLAADRLHFGLAGGRVAGWLISYGVVFFGIWWAWVNFTWFASAYDTDDVVYRIFVFVTITGALVLAAGVPRAFDERDFGLAVLGYVVMRIALVTQWLRVGRDDPERRRTAHRYALGVTACQIVWAVAAVWLPFEVWLLVFAVFGPAELLVPVWAESASPTTWHAEHIAERYGLFMIIVLGESVLASSIAIQSATSDGGFTGRLLVVAAGLLTLFSIWWLYFDRPAEPPDHDPRHLRVGVRAPAGVRVGRSRWRGPLAVDREGLAPDRARLGRDRCRCRHTGRGLPPQPVGAPRSRHGSADPEVRRARRDGAPHRRVVHGGSPPDHRPRADRPPRSSFGCELTARS